MQLADIGSLRRGLPQQLLDTQDPFAETRLVCPEDTFLHPQYKHHRNGYRHVQCQCQTGNKQCDAAQLDQQTAFFILFIVVLQGGPFMAEG